MSADASAYSTLGLEPDADSADIERAYRRLIKLHHPDRDGGDADRAAEINRAYRQLSARPSPEQALEFHEPEGDPRGRPWIRSVVVLLVAGLLALLAGTDPVRELIHKLSTAPASTPARVSGAGPADVMDQPIHRTEVSDGLQDAVRITARHSDAALIDASRDCHRRLQTDPSVALLDRCAAFDDAVVQLKNQDAMWDRGEFSQMAVTGRQWSAASQLSHDYLAVDDRLDHIRLQVELALAASQPANTAEPAANEATNGAD